MECRGECAHSKLENKFRNLLLLLLFVVAVGAGREGGREERKELKAAQINAIDESTSTCIRSSLMH